MHLLAASGFTFLEDVVAILAIVSAIVAGWVAVRKLGPEKDAIYISSAQGAAVIQTNLIATLQTEVERERQQNLTLSEQIGRLQAEVERLRAANLALTRRYGSRHEDREEPRAE